uniref:C-type lectin domain-containing protein n=1 Tax=Plectus sambesii TaxID=2011161 RepID=A0A914X194_9BILA
MVSGWNLLLTLFIAASSYLRLALTAVCDSSPCRYGATCNDLTTSYTCTCHSTFFTGTNCESHLTYSYSSPAISIHIHTAEQLTWALGVQLCLKMGKRPVAINNDTINSFIKTLATSNSVQYVIIGVSDLNKADMNQADYKLLDGTSLTLSNPWTAGFETGTGSSKWCTKMDVSTGQWLQMLCEDSSDRAVAVCETTGTTYTSDTYLCAGYPCQNGGTCTEVSGSVSCTCMPTFTSSRCELHSFMGYGTGYYFHNHQDTTSTSIAPYTRQQAQELCTSFTDPSLKMLAVVYDAAMFTYIYNYIQTQTSTTSLYWIGLKKSGADYIWPDGSSLTDRGGFNKWASGQPGTDDCVTMGTDGLWKTAVCTSTATPLNDDHINYFYFYYFFYDHNDYYVNHVNHVNHNLFYNNNNHLNNHKHINNIDVNNYTHNNNHFNDHKLIHNIDINNYLLDNYKLFNNNIDVNNHPHNNNHLNNHKHINNIDVNNYTYNNNYLDNYELINNININNYLLDNYKLFNDNIDINNININNYLLDNYKLFNNNIDINNHPNNNNHLNNHKHINNIDFNNYTYNNNYLDNYKLFNNFCINNNPHNNNLLDNYKHINNIDINNHSNNSNQLDNHKLFNNIDINNHPHNNNLLDNYKLFNYIIHNYFKHYIFYDINTNNKYAHCFVFILTLQRAVWLVLKNFLQLYNSSRNDYEHIDPIHNDDLHNFNYHHHDGNSNNYKSGINEHHYSNYYYDDDRSSHINNNLLHNIHIFYLNDFHDNHDNIDEYDYNYSTSNENINDVNYHNKHNNSDINEYDSIKYNDLSHKDTNK